MQEDSNGESTFEFVDKKLDDMSISHETIPKAGKQQFLVTLRG